MWQSAGTGKSLVLGSRLAAAGAAAAQGGRRPSSPVKPGIGIAAYLGQASAAGGRCRAHGEMAAPSLGLPRGGGRRTPGRCWGCVWDQRVHPARERLQEAVRNAYILKVCFKAETLTQVN